MGADLTSPKSAKIVVLGSVSMDLIARVPRLPKLGETLIAGHYSELPGGKGANQAVACARLGAQVAMLGRVGQDAFGAALLSALGSEGIDTSHVARDGSALTGVALIGVDESTGDNSIMVAPGANYRVSVAEIEAAKEMIEQADSVVCSLEVPLESVEAAAVIASRRGVRFILNPSPVPAQPLSETLLKAVSVLTLNEHEAMLMAPGRSELETVHASARRLQGQIAGTVIVTLGAAGSLAIFSSGLNGSSRMAAAQFGPVVDTIGAGDCFTAGLAVGLAEGQPLIDAMRLATAAAGISVTRQGAQSSMPTREEVKSTTYSVFI